MGKKYHRKKKQKNPQNLSYVVLDISLAFDIHCTVQLCSFSTKSAPCFLFFMSHIPNHNRTLNIKSCSKTFFPLTKTFQKTNTSLLS